MISLKMIELTINMILFESDRKTMIMFLARHVNAQGYFNSEKKTHIRILKLI